MRELKDAEPRRLTEAERAALNKRAWERAMRSRSA